VSLLRLSLGQGVSAIRRIPVTRVLQLEQSEDADVGCAFSDRAAAYVMKAL